MNTDFPSSERTVKVPELTNDENGLINKLLREIERRRVSNLLRTSYYEHKRTIRQVGTLIPPQYFTLGLSIGWVAKAVDALARRCNLDGFVWPDGDLDSIGGAEVWDDNHLGSEVNGAIVAALIHGPSFLVNTMGDEGEPDALIHVKNATEATGEWNRRRRHLDNLLSIIETDDDGELLSLALYLDNETITAQRDKANLAWQVDRTEHVYGVPAEVLPFKPEAARPFGRSRITQPMMGFQDDALRTLIRREGHMDVYSYPDYWLLGADESAFQNPDGTQKTVWQMRLGFIKGVNDDKDENNPQLARADVKQFPAASPEPHWTDMNGLAKMFAREASLPDSALAITDVSNPTSAESYDASQYELIAEAEVADDDFTPALRKSFVRALAMRNEIPIVDVPDEWRSIDTQWRNPRYLAKSAEADAGAKQLAMCPELQGSDLGYELLGFSPQQVKQAVSIQRRARGRALIQDIRQRAQQSVTSGDDNGTAQPDQRAV